ncbi:hypothetical protein [Streptomyces sp. NPDC057413]|uniref:hypothetical protein n=1 Tax=Streptomyces sp. NPDC057413 TaxID=3346124 RepID=UPI0036C1602E
MRDHLADEELIGLVRRAPGEEERRHLDGCAGCRARLADWRALAPAVREAEAERDVSVPSFDALLAPVLTAEAGLPDHAPGVGAADAGVQVAGAPVPVPAVSRGRARAPWRLAWQLARTEAALLPRLWAPFSAVGLVVAAVVAPLLDEGRLGARLFGAVCVALIVLAGLVVASPRRDPRGELMFTLQVPPGTVFLARMAVVIGADLVLAVACSALIGGPGWWPVVAGWLGEALLASSLALALAVRVAPAVGLAAGGSLWLLGVVTGPQGLVSTPLRAVLGPLLVTSPWTVGGSVLLMVWATGAMRRYPGVR